MSDDSHFSGGNKIKTHKDLIVWQRSIALVKGIYLTTQRFPQHELYGITSQMRRAAVSVPSNIAEGAARNSAKDFTRFLYLALGSLSELETQIIISNELGFLPQDSSMALTDKCVEIRRMMLALIKRIKQDPGIAAHNS